MRRHLVSLGYDIPQKKYAFEPEEEQANRSNHQRYDEQGHNTQQRVDTFNGASAASKF